MINVEDEEYPNILKPQSNKKNHNIYYFDEIWWECKVVFEEYFTSGFGGSIAAARKE